MFRNATEYELRQDSVFHRGLQILLQVAGIGIAAKFEDVEVSETVSGTLRPSFTNLKACSLRAHATTPRIDASGFPGPSEAYLRLCSIITLPKGPKVVPFWDYLIEF